MRKAGYITLVEIMIVVAIIVVIVGAIFATSIQNTIQQREQRKAENSLVENDPVASQALTIKRQQEEYYLTNLFTDPNGVKVYRFNDVFGCHYYVVYSNKTAMTLEDVPKSDD